jgi:Recombinase zinc beta ribbon domain
VRRGELLLAGLLRCGHCSRKLQVGYGGKTGRYFCARTTHSTERCISIGGFSSDRAVSAEVLRILKPLGVDAAVKALNVETSETSAAQKQLTLALQQARYEAAHARRQYDAVDPDNRLVAGELERRWNEALQVVHRIEGEIATLEAKKPAPLGELERQHLMELGTDLELAWSHAAATTETRKRILRAALNEIVVRREGGFIEMVLHWHVGEHTPLKFKANAVGKNRWTIPEDTLSLIRELARQMPDRQIARLLNRVGKPTGRGNGWTEERVRSFRSHHDIAVYRQGEWAERGEITLEAAAQIIGVTTMTALRMLQRGDIKGQQLCKGAPWVIKAEDVAAFGAGKQSRRPLTPNPAQRTFDYQ